MHVPLRDHALQLVVISLGRSFFFFFFFSPYLFFEYLTMLHLFEVNNVVIPQVSQPQV